MGALALEQQILAGGVARRCRVCGCTQDHACVDDEHGPCWWVEPDLCSHCGEPLIVAADFDRMADDMIAAGDRPVTKPELDLFFLWMRRARAALAHASTTSADAFEPRPPGAF